MSRIGKAIINIPAGTTVSVNNDNIVTAKGPKGELKQAVHPEIYVNIDGSVITMGRPSESIIHKSLHGLSRSLGANLVKGVSDGYTKELELVGVGFKAACQGNILDLALGYSHNIIFEIPKELTISTAQEKGQNPIITLGSVDKQLLGQVCAKIRGLRKPEPYKGKGVKFKGEVLRRKAGKSAGK